MKRKPGRTRKEDKVLDSQASFQDLRGLTYFAGTIYLLDGTAATLRSFDPFTREIRTLAGRAGLARVLLRRENRETKRWTITPRSGKIAFSAGMLGRP